MAIFVCVSPERQQMDGHHMVVVVGLVKHLLHHPQIRSHTCVRGKVDLRPFTSIKRDVQHAHSKYGYTNKTG